MVRLRNSTLLTALVAIAAAWSAGSCLESPENELGPIPSAVIFLSLDTFRADRLELYGYQRATAPNLSALGEESLTFTAASAQATQTLVSHKSILTGKYPLRLIRETTNADLAALETLENPTQFLVNTFQGLKAEPLVADFMDRGYRTAGFVDGGWMSRKMGFARGFDTFDEEGGGLEEILPRVHRFLDENKDDRFFLFIHAYDLHCPYTSREPYNSRFCPDHSGHVPLEEKCGKPELMSASLTEDDRSAVSDHYDGGIVSADAHVGELLQKLRELDLYDESLLIVTSDHGDSFGEHGQIGHGGLQLEQLLVPLIVKLPASWAVPPRKIREPVELVDVLPTVADMLGIQAADDLDGRSLLPLIEEGAWERRFLVAQTTFEAGPDSVSAPASRAMLVPGRWLLVHEPGSDTVAFDLSQDPRALSAIANASELPDTARLLNGLLTVGTAGGSGAFTPLEDVTLDEDLLKELQSLGYLK